MIQLEVQASTSVIIQCLKTALTDLLSGDGSCNYLFIVRPIPSDGIGQCGSSQCVDVVHSMSRVDRSVSSESNCESPGPVNTGCPRDVGTTSHGDGDCTCCRAVSSGSGVTGSVASRQAVTSHYQDGIGSDQSQSVSNQQCTEALRTVTTTALCGNGFPIKRLRDSSNAFNVDESFANNSSSVSGGSVSQSAVCRTFSKSRAGKGRASASRWWRSTGDEFLPGGSRLRSGDGNLPCVVEDQQERCGEVTRLRSGRVKNNAIGFVQSEQSTCSVASTFPDRHFCRCGLSLSEKKSSRRKRGKGGLTYAKLKELSETQKAKIDELELKVVYLEDCAILPVL